MNPESPYTQGGQAPYQPQPAPSQYPGVQPAPAPQPAYAPIPPSHTPLPVSSRRTPKVWIILTFVFLGLTIGSAVFGVWAYMNYLDQRDNVESKVTSAVASAVKEEQDAAAAHLLEVENTPNRQFTGPSDYGNVTFDYSKLWSVFVEKDAAKGGTYAAYLNPVAVPPIASAERYALRVTIEEKDYDQVINSYQSLVTKGDLKASTYKIDDTTSGTRLDGAFTKDIRGSAVIFKIRDKTVTLRSDAETFKEYFDALIKTVKYDK